MVSPSLSFLQVSVCLNPKWLPLVDVPAQVPSHPLERHGRKPWDSGLGPRPHVVLERPPAVSPEGELIQAWLEGGSGTLPKGQGTLLRCHCRHNPGLPGPSLSYSTELSPKSKVSPEAAEGAAARTGMSLRSRRPRGPHSAGLWSSGKSGCLGPGARRVLTCSSWGRGSHRRIPCPRWRRSSRR